MNRETSKDRREQAFPASTLNLPIEPMRSRPSYRPRRVDVLVNLEPRPPMLISTEFAQNGVAVFRAPNVFGENPQLRPPADQL